MFQSLRAKLKSTKPAPDPQVRNPRPDDPEKDDSIILRAVYSWVILLLGVSVLLFLQIPFFQEQHRRALAFSEELAFALILAGLFSLTVEKYHREEFRKFVIVERDKLKRDVFLYAYGHAVHEQTRQQIKDRILDCPFHRDEMRLEWYFSPVAGKKDKLRVEKTFSYVQKNGTKLPQKYHYQLHQNTTTSILKQVVEEQSQWVRIRRKEKPEIYLQRQPSLIQDGLVEAPELRELQTDEVGEMQPGEEIEVSVSTTETRELSSDDSYSSKHPIVGRTLVTVYVDGGLALTASAYCKSRPLDFRTEHHPPHVYAWQTQEGILPYQGIMISWSPVAFSEPTGADTLKTDGVSPVRS